MSAFPDLTAKGLSNPFPLVWMFHETSALSSSHTLCLDRPIFAGIFAQNLLMKKLSLIRWES
jgi:hypothetical protein